MAASPDIRSQLKSLQISREQRPAQSGKRGGGRGRRAMIALAAAGVAGGIYFEWGRFGSETARAEAAKVSVVTVTERRGPVSATMLTATGKIVSDHHVEVATKVSGQVVELRFEQGDFVRQGQVLARIEDIVYRARRDEARAMLLKAEATVEFQKRNFDRVKGLHDRANAPPIEYADAVRSRDESVAQRDAARATLDYAEKNLRDCEVAAPITGVILERNVEVGDFVAAEGGRGAMANSQFAAIADMKSLRVEVDVSELDIARLHKGMACRVTPDAYKDRNYPGRVMWIDPGANYSKATVQVKVRIENPDEFLRVEGSAQVAFLSEPDAATTQGAGDETGLWIPRSACRREAGSDRGTVFVVAGGRVTATAVKLGRERASEVEVRDGLKAGQVIAAEGVEKLRDGQTVNGGKAG